MAFEVYKLRGEKSEKPPLVTLSKNSIVINKPAREKLGEVEQVQLAYDKDSKIIRIKAVDEGGQNLKKTKVFAKGFFNYFDLNKTGKFVANYDEKDNALYVRLG